MQFFSANHEKWTHALFEKIKKHYGSRLVSLAIYGSYARQEARLNSDLDLFIVLTDFAGKSRGKTTEDFIQHIERPLKELSAKCWEENIQMEISPMIFRREQAAHFLPLYLDMVEHHKMIVDQDDFLKNILKHTEEKMKKWGSVKEYVGKQWYWQICPGLKWGEKLNYDE